ncbi:hypothetical protein C5C40_09790 [Rathayibacter rathayi]|uniref:Uncharacterized protein n=1 Tax=Rathayibacter rathayi TaxID=33887 RepID=A0ABD6W6E6_RATRA|nr:hypothetical protein C5C04_11620 [Rathayibacter rathayi]PPH76042.1 hypothetical protein C5C40_09790 [Rathayibacter rathayi]
MVRLTCTPEIVPQAVPLYEDRVKASVGDPEAAAAGVAVVTATAGTAHAAPLTRVRRPTPFSAGMLQPSLRAMVWGVVGFFMQYSDVLGDQDGSHRGDSSAP